MPYLVDSHCHLASLSYKSEAFSSLPELLKRAYRCKVTHFLSIACTLDEFKKQQELTQGYNNIYLSAGIHPLNLAEASDWQEDDLAECFKDPRAIALGECGLDYHYSPDNKPQQLEAFARQIALSHEIKKPLIIHAREAAQDTISLLKSENARDCGGVVHCFTDTVDMARVCLDLGFYISFTGIATFKASDNVREVLKYVPLDRMMVETDCPYLAPIPVRGVENEPAFVRYTAEYIADFKHVAPAKLAAVTSKNFEDLYKVKLAEPQSLDIEVSEYKLKPNILDVPLR